VNYQVKHAFPLRWYLYDLENQNDWFRSKKLTQTYEINLKLKTTRDKMKILIKP